LGDKALPYGFNTFPINVQGHEDDYLLHTDGNNCPKFNASLIAAWPAFEIKTQTNFKDFLARLNQLFGTTMDVKTALYACDYLSWAYYHDIDLTFSYMTADVTTCDQLTNSYYNLWLDVDESLGYLAANQFLKKTLDQLKSMTGHLAYHETFFYKHFLSRSREDEMLGSVLDNQPRFYFYTTEQQYMRMLLSGLMGKANRAANPQVFDAAPKPSLQFAIEVIQNTDGTKVVKAHLGDNDVVLGGCSNTPCNIEAFKAYLTTVATKDVPTECSAK
jgi:hypothetical protein